MLIFNYRVILGEYRRLSPDGTEQVRGVRSICKHPTYDAAVLFLTSDVVFNSAVRPIKLSTTTPPVGQLLKTGSSYLNL